MKILLPFQEKLEMKMHKGILRSLFRNSFFRAFSHAEAFSKFAWIFFRFISLLFLCFFLHMFFCLNILFIFFAFAFQALFSKIAFYYSIFFSKSQYFKLKVYKIVTFLSKHDLWNIRWAWFESNERSIDYESIALTTMLQAQEKSGGNSPIWTNDLPIIGRML